MKDLNEKKQTFAVSDLAPKRLRGEGFKPRKKASNEALPRQIDVWKNRPAYKTGDGDFQIASRVGQDDHQQYKSLVERMK